MSKSEFVDPRDGQRYPVVRLRDGRRWFAANLRFASPGSLAAPNSDGDRERHAPGYEPVRAGRSYHFMAADLACPPGWHLPTHAEWTGMLAKYGPIEEKAWMGNSELRCDTVELLEADGFDPVGTAIGEGGYDHRTGSSPEASAFFKDGTLSCRFWIKDAPASLWHRLRGRPRTSPITMTGGGGEKAEAAFFVCITDNVYIHAESIGFWYSVRCIEN